MSKKAAEQAVIPPPQFIREMVEEVEKEPEPGEQRDKLMLEFAQSDAWKLVKGYMESKLRELAGRVREASDGSRSLEEVGYKYLAADHVGQFVAGVISYVETPLRLKKAEAETEKK